MGTQRKINHLLINKLNYSNNNRSRKQKQKIYKNLVIKKIPIHYKFTA